MAEFDEGTSAGGAPPDPSEELDDLSFSEALDTYNEARDSVAFDEAINDVRSGLPFSALERLQLRAGLSQAEVAAVVGIPERTILRRQKNQSLTPTESDRVDRITRLLELATQVIADEANAREWLHRENGALGGATPLSLLDTDRGVRAVEDVLMRIERGMYS